jgi:hypothetical protein
VRGAGPGRRAGLRRGQGRGIRMRGGGSLSLREAGERVQPNLGRSTVASIIRIFQQTNR